MSKNLAVTTVAIGLAITIGLIGVGHKASAQATSGSAIDYPKLAVVLSQLSQAPDPVQFANEKTCSMRRRWYA
jgi:hypothetical protein